MNYGLGQLAALPYSRFTGPRILVNNLAAGTGIYNAGVAGGGGVLSGLVGGIVNQFVGKATNELIGKATGAIKDVFSGLGNRIPAEQLLAAQNAQEVFRGFERAAEYGAALDEELERLGDIAGNYGADLIDNNELFNTIEAGDIPEEFLNLPEFEFDPDFGATLGDFAG